MGILKKVLVGLGLISLSCESFVYPVSVARPWRLCGSHLKKNEICAQSTRQDVSEVGNIQGEYTYKQVLVTDPVSTELALLAANRAFYAAFRSGDFDAMANALHPDDEQVSVVHPGIPPLYGRKAVLQSWRAVLASPPSVFPSDARVVQIHDDVAWLHCFEALDGSEGVKLAATNIFKRDAQGIWRIVLHHAGSCCM